jgi:hypothetical protein
MEITEITEILRHIDNMNIHNIEIEMGEVSIKVTKSNIANTQPLQATTTMPPAVFSTAAEFKAEPRISENGEELASKGQVKFATDLAEKLSPGTPNNVINFLAHALELPLEEIPLPDTWEDTMTKDMAGLYLDILDHEHKKQRKQQGGGWS